MVWPITGANLTSVKRGKSMKATELAAGQEGLAGDKSRFHSLTREKAAGRRKEYRPIRSSADKIGRCLGLVCCFPSPAFAYASLLQQLYTRRGRIRLISKSTAAVEWKATHTVRQFRH